MSDAVNFYLKLLNDESLKKSVDNAVKQASNKDERFKLISQIAKQNGYSISSEELIEEAHHLRGSLEELEDEDLENVAGGCPDGYIFHRLIPIGHISIKSKLQKILNLVDIDIDIEIDTQGED